jgi:spore maturation protein CgeB
MAKTFSNQIRFMKEHGGKAWMRKLKAKAHPRPDSTIFRGSIRKKPDASEYIEVTQQSVVTLGINRYPSFRHSLSAPDTYSRLRDLEAPMLGACYLTEWTEGLDKLYEPGREIETYSNAEEMAYKIEMLKADRERRLALRRNGQRRALAEHSVTRTLAKLVAAL